MKNVLTVLFMMILGVCPVFAQWVNVQDIKDPIRLLDTKSIKDVSYKNNEGVIFALRYIGKNNKENVATFFADFKNEKAGVISIKPYFKDMKYDFIIPDNFEMKNISDFKTNFLEIEKYAKGRNVEQSPTVEYLKEETAEKTGEQSKINWNPYITNIEKSIKMLEKISDYRNSSSMIERAKKQLRTLQYREKLQKIFVKKILQLIIFFTYCYIKVFML